MKHSGNLRKMAVSLTNPVHYEFVLGEQKIALNKYLGQEIELHFTGKINCIACDRPLKKTYQQGYCFPCTQKLAQCDLCILKPEKCHYAEGTCREPNWGEQYCMQQHIVYLANTSGIKVGITRKIQVPTRWIDQGAVQALPIANIQTRLQSGLLELAFAELVADKTNWRKMLQTKVEKVDLASKRDELLAEVASKIQKIAAKFPLGDIELLTAEKVVDINYPIVKTPEKISSLNFDKTPIIKNKLQGIKGQYLIFDSGVINIRNFAGYEVELIA